MTKPDRLPSKIDFIFFEFLRFAFAVNKEGVINININKMAKNNFFVITLSP